MITNLTIRNFFSYYIFYPNANSLSPKEQTIAKIASVALRVLTLGLAHLFCRSFFYDRTIGQIKVAPPKMVQALQKTPIAPVQISAADLKPSIVSQEANKTIVKCGEIQIELAIIKDICSLSRDAIVNAANAQLVAGSGVCGGIYSKGGNTIFQECADKLADQGKTHLEEGEAMITGGGTLKAKHVIHAVGPIWKNTESEMDKDKQRLYSAYTNSLKCAADDQLTSLAFPSLSTGIFGFPLQLAAPIAIKAIMDYAVSSQNSSVKEISFALWPGTFKFYNDALLEAIKA